jgi:hypothetical protein
MGGALLVLVEPLHGAQRVVVRIPPNMLEESEGSTADLSARGIIRDAYWMYCI